MSYFYYNKYCHKCYQYYFDDNHPTYCTGAVWINPVTLNYIPPLTTFESPQTKYYRKILIGVANVILNDAGQILVSRRLADAKIGVGKLATPGGCLEENEHIVDCAKREVLEETGLVIQPFPILGSYTFHVVEYFHAEGIHNLTLYVASRVESGEVTNNEPTKHTEWTWVSLQQLNTLSAPTDDWIPVEKLTLLREKGLI